MTEEVKIQDQSSTLERLCDRAREWKTERRGEAEEGRPRSSISVARAGVPRWLAFTVGVVWIDRLRAGYLIGGKPKVIRLEPGEHTVAVEFSDEGFGRRRITTEPIVLGPGERVDLVCGLEAGWFRDWWRRLVCCVSYPFAVWVGIRFLPRPREIIASAMISLQADGPWVSWAYTFFGSSLCGAILAVLLWHLLIGRRLWGPDRNPYFIAKKPDTAGPELKARGTSSIP